MYQFGKLGFSEIFSQTFRDLDKRIQLECDGNIIQLPSLQGRDHEMISSVLFCRSKLTFAQIPMIRHCNYEHSFLFRRRQLLGQLG